MKDDQENEILGYLRIRESATINELSEKFYLSPSSIRRKLDCLQEKGLIVRTHGGARTVSDNSMFPSFTFRSHQNPVEKKKIALTAVKFIKDGDVIFLDGSTSVFFIAEYLRDMRGVRVITNGIDTLSMLSKMNVRAYSTGGEVSETNRSVLIGQNAINMVNSYHADAVFFSAQSIRSDGEIYDCFEEENYVRQAMMKQSGKKIFLCDSTKFGRDSAFRLCSADDVDAIVTDGKLGSHLEKRFLGKILG